MTEREREGGREREEGKREGGGKEGGACSLSLCIGARVQVMLGMDVVSAPDPNHPSADGFGSGTETRMDAN